MNMTSRRIGMLMPIMAVAMAIVFAIGGCAQATTAQELQVAEPEYNWAGEADLIVVGGGGAGFAAAIEAGKAGASVLILEKASIPGGNTLRSGGMIMAGGTEMQASLGITDTKERFAEHAMAENNTAGDIEMVREMCLASPDEVAFMSGLGREYTAVFLMAPEWDYDTDETWAKRVTWNPSDSRGHFLTLQATTENMDNVRCYTDTEVVSLITSSNNEVLGVKTAAGDLYRANKGVVLACGSFDHNMEMSEQYNQMNAWAMSFEEKYDLAPTLQTFSNTGDGIRMAQAIGADLMLSHANCIVDLSLLSVQNPANNSILVNSNGQRFVQESAHWGYLGSAVYNEAVRTNKLDTDNFHFWVIMDQKTINDNAYLKMLVDGVGSSAVKAEFAQYVKKSDSIEALAEMAGLPVANLTETVQRWNGFCEEGLDRDFYRKDLENWTSMGKLEKAPYYAVPYYPYSMGSFGGLKTNIETQVLDTNGNPIPRLYAAGAIMSGMYSGEFYSSCGWSILGTVHWGRMAGANIVALDAWTTEPVEEKASAQAQPDMASATGSYNAGAYSATVKGNNGEFTVTVDFSDTALVSVTVGENTETNGIGSVAIEKLPGRIVEAQSADVDTLSSATVTSQAIIDGVKDCMAQAAK